MNVGRQRVVRLVVVRPGPLTTVQDLGRPGYAALGVSTSGAADRGALRCANALVGNSPTAAALELTFGGLRLRCLGKVKLALAGAPLPVRVVGPDGEKSDRSWGAAFDLLAGEQVDLGRPAVGLRSYLAVRGGFATPMTLGSRSTDVLSGIGPAALIAGLGLAVGTDSDYRGVTAQLSAAQVAQVAQPASSFSPVLLRISLGPRDDWFTAEGLHTLTSQDWQVSPDSNRIAMKLIGEVVRRSRMDELPSEGLLPGAIQIPQGGMPVLFLADHPVTGGYPVIAVVLRSDVDLAAQVRPGGLVRFTIA